MATSTQPDLVQLARLFHALSDETRLGLVVLLRDGERCVCDLTASFASGQSRLSFHLKTLKAAGLVRDRKEGRWSYYSLVPRALQGMENSLAALSPGLVMRAIKAGCC